MYSILFSYFSVLYLLITLYESAEIAQVTSHHGGKMHKWTLMFRGKYTEPSQQIRKHTISKMITLLLRILSSKKTC